MKFTHAIGAAARLVAIAAAGLLSNACVDESGIVLITQNQIPAYDSMTGKCETSATGSEIPRQEGVLDLGVGDAANYVVYPVVESRLPPLATMGRAEPNTVQLSFMRITLHPPPGYTFPWTGCSNTSEPSFGNVTLDPGASQSGTFEAILPCQARQILAQFKPGGLNPDLNERIYFTVEMRAYGRRSSGDQLTSDPFRLPVRVCVGCLQTAFPALAQYNYPGLPRCDVAPRPNPYKGNPCNIAQDIGPLLCCLDENSKAICPSPDQ